MKLPWESKSNVENECRITAFMNVFEQPFTNPNTFIDILYVDKVALCE